MHKKNSPAVFWPVEVVASWGNDENKRITYALTLLNQIKKLAVVPVSQFQVAAIVIDEQGNAYAGINQEFQHAVMGQTVHAEQSAIAHAWARGAKSIRHVVVNYPPCGHCRQFMNELRNNHSLQIHLPEQQYIPLHSLLPHDFGPAHLAMTTRLLDAQCNKVQMVNELDDALMQAAVSAAQSCYAPYSKAYAGVALQLDNGEHITGCYAENAAYNPSLPPLQSALNGVYLRGLDICTITDIALARVVGHGHAAHAKALWQTFSTIPLRTAALNQYSVP